ncbi:hypothetical protein V7F95_01990 [Cutibacterium avidum]|uniref:hypothetical protein n=1 Tax=Cutibacterium avidum TaxID=33010 RepID=UPI00306B3BB4
MREQIYSLPVDDAPTTPRPPQRTRAAPGDNAPEMKNTGRRTVRHPFSALVSADQ